jgi:Transcriptional regulatory protein, C terminal
VEEARREAVSTKATAQRAAGRRSPHGHVVSVEPEVDLVARLDAEAVSEVLGDDDLALGAHLGGHTWKYNPALSLPRPPAHLARRSPEVVTRRELLAEVWRQAYGGADKTVDVHLSWLRRKLGETGSVPRYLHTVRGVGVKLTEPAGGPGGG